MRQSSFYLMIADHDHRQFTVEGPMSDDRPWNLRVVDAQRLGSDVTCSFRQAAASDNLRSEGLVLHGYQDIDESRL